MPIIQNEDGGFTITGKTDVMAYGWLALRSKLAMHLRCEAFNRRQIMQQLRAAGYMGRTAKAAWPWIMDQCNKRNLPPYHGETPWLK
jgi:hypothetical protein